MQFITKLSLGMCVGMLASTSVAQGVPTVIYDSDGYEPVNTDGTTFTATQDLEGQDTTDGPWKESMDTNNANAIVTTQPPGQVESGLQSAQVHRDANGYGAWGVEQLVDDVDPNRPISIEWDMYVENASTGPNDTGYGPFFGVAAIDANDTTTTFPLYAAYVGQDASTGEFLYANENFQTAVTGDTFTLDQWHNYQILLDYGGPTGGQYTVRVDGSDVITTDFIDDEFGVGIDDLTDAPLSVDAASGDQTSAQRPGTAYYDNYIIRQVPEPSTAAALLILLGVSAVGLRRRRCYIEQT